MIDLDDDKIVRRVDAYGGRFLLFHRVDLKPRSPLPFSGVVLDTSGDGIGLAVTLDPDPTGEAWSLLDLLSVALARTEAEQHRRLGPLVDDVTHHLVQAMALERRRYDGLAPDRIELVPGYGPSPYPWTEAWRGQHTLPLCPDPESRQEGVTPEQVLLVIERILAEARLPPAQQRLRQRLLDDHIRHALEAERRRVERLRQTL